MIVAQLAEKSLPIPEDPGSNPSIRNITRDIYLLFQMWRKWRNKIPTIVHFKTLCTDFARTCILIFRWICSCARDRRNLLQNIFCQKQVSSDDPKMTESDFRYYVQNCWDKRFKKRVFKRRKRNFFTNFWRVTKLGKFWKFLATNFLSNDFGDFWG